MLMTAKSFSTVNHHRKLKRSVISLKYELKFTIHLPVTESSYENKQA